MEELHFLLRAFVESKPCSLTQLVYERSIIADNTAPGELLLFPQGKKLPIQDFLKKSIIEVHPFVGPRFDSSEFTDFLNKYSLVQRELLYKALRNKSRQRRSIPRYYEDFSILFNEANTYDNLALQQMGQQPREGNTVALTLVINAVLANSLDFLNLGFELELYALHELQYVFSYLKYLYMLIILNRKSMVLGMAGDEIVKKGLIVLEDLPNSADKYRQKRRKFSPLQKLMVDEFE